MKNFEHYTEKLSEKEKTVYVPWFVRGLSPKVGKENAVTNPKMIEGINRVYGVKLSEPQVRKIIAYIRENDLLPGLVATQKGYYVSNDPEEIKEYIESLKAREAGFRAAIQSMERFLIRIS